jgi:hypothetical protein
LLAAGSIEIRSNVESTADAFEATGRRERLKAPSVIAHASPMLKVNFY